MSSVHATRFALAVLVLVLALSAPVRAQFRAPGSWILVGVGVGVAHIACDGCGAWTVGDRTVFGSLGGRVTPRFGIGIGLDQWWHTADDSVATGTRVVLLVRYRPSIRSNAFVEAGGGVSRADLRVRGNSQGKGSGFGFIVRLGYNAPVPTARGDSSKYYLAPELSYADGVIEQLVPFNSGNFYLTKGQHRLLAVGVAVGIRF